MSFNFSKNPFLENSCTYPYVNISVFHNYQLKVTILPMKLLFLTFENFAKHFLQKVSYRMFTIFLK